MRPGPIRRLSGAVGLLALAPVAYRLATGGLAPVDAAIRALVTLLAVVVLGRVLATWLGQVADTFDVAPGDEHVEATADDHESTAA